MLSFFSRPFFPVVLAVFILLILWAGWFVFFTPKIAEQDQKQGVETHLDIQEQRRQQTSRGDFFDEVTDEEKSEESPALVESETGEVSDGVNPVFSIPESGSDSGTSTPVSDKESAEEGPAAELTTVQISSKTQGLMDAFYYHPDPGAELPAVLYLHGKIVVDKGYEGAVASGYDVKDFVNALAGAGYVTLAPIRTRMSPTDDSVKASVAYLKSQSDVDTSHIFVMGFSLGGTLSLVYGTTTTDDIAGMILLAPAVDSDDELDTILSKINNVSFPVFIAMGSREPNPGIEENVPKIRDALLRAGKDVTSNLAYDGDHAWFYDAGHSFWNDVLNFLGRFD